MNDNKKQAKSLNEQLLAIAETVEKMADAEIALTEAYVQSLKELNSEFEEKVREEGISAVPTM